MTISFTEGQTAAVRPGVGTPLFELRSITKEFPNVRALDKVSLDVYAGEVVALIGENGAGKSTLLRILNGDYQPDSGEILFNGQPARIASPSDAHRMGVRVIYQEPEIIPSLSVAENLYIGELPRRFARFVDWPRLYQEVRAQLARLGFENEINPHSLAEKLSPAQRQLIEILRALKAGVQVLALDEPTSSLSDEEASRLFAIVKRLKQTGVGIVYVTHRLREILHLADRVAILRDGQLVATKPASDTNETEMMSLMVGRPLSNLFNRHSHVTSEVVLKVEGLTTSRIKNISFDLRKGEVLGFAGLIGAGRTDVAKALFGAEPITAGTVEIDGKPVRIRNPRDAMNAGIGYTPEDRKGEALLKILSVRENISLAMLRELSTLHFVNLSKERQIAGDVVQKLSVKTPSIAQEMGKLSGGNQQKVILGRWLSRLPKVLILDEPTRGIDVGAKAEIYQLIDSLAERGYGVLFISSELPEVLGVSDRIIVMQAGRITGELQTSEASEEIVLNLAIADHLTKLQEQSARKNIVEQDSLR
jgi:L-arabinose transport system ATP-binding protein